MKAVFVAALVLLLGADVAQAGSVVPVGLETRDVTFNHEAGQEGKLLLASVGTKAGVGEGETSLYIDLRAAHVEATQYETSFTAVPTGEMENSDPREIPYSADDARLRIKSSQPFFGINLIGAPDGNAFTTRSDEGGFTSVASARMGNGGLRSGLIDDDAPPWEFSTVERAGPLLLFNGGPAHGAVHVEGSFTLELWNVTLEDGEGTVLESGEWRTPVVPQAPDVSMLVAHSTRRAFLRVTVTDAQLDIATTGGEPRIEWVAAAVTSEHEGPITLTGASGRVKGPDGERLVEDERVVLPAATLALTARPGQTIGVEVVPPAGAPAGQAPVLHTIVASPLLLSTGIAALVIVASALGAVLVLAIRRRLRTPHLKEVEAAIAKEQYPLAAKLASRILRQKPDQEDALIGRAIALSRGGHPARVVAEVEVHLKRRDPSDGVLHYVLGLAYLDLGRHQEAESALREAVRRTPSLEGEVQSRLPGLALQLQSSQSEMKEAHGYA